MRRAIDFVNHLQLRRRAERAEEFALEIADRCKALETEIAKLRNTEVELRTRIVEQTRDLQRLSEERRRLIQAQIDS